MSDWCPIIQLDCLREGCREWQFVRGEDPRTGAPIERFECRHLDTVPNVLMQLTKAVIEVDGTIGGLRSDVNRSRPQIPQDGPIKIRDLNNEAQQTG